MKKLVYLFVVAIVATAGVFWSCQKDEIVPNPENGLKLKSGDLCCFEAPYVYTYDFDWGNGNNSGSYEIKSWNDDEFLYINIAASNGIALSDESMISFPYRQKDNGKGIKYDDYVPAMNEGVLTFTLPLNILDFWEYCQEISFGLKISSTAPEQEISYSQILTELSLQSSEQSSVKIWE